MYVSVGISQRFKKTNFINSNSKLVLNFLVLLFISIGISGCNLKENDTDGLKIEIEKLSQKNKELELRQQELEHKANEFNISKSNQDEKNINKKYSAPELFDKYNRSVFKIFVLDRNNELYGTGTGFLIGNKGYAVTNYHVLENAYKAYIELINGDVININNDKIINYDKEKDFAVFKLESEKKLYGFEDYSDLPIANGTTVFTIGNPAGGESNTISQGIVTGQNWKDIQFSAPIDHGSSGSPLFNIEGKIVGLVWGGKHEGNLYRAIKISHLDLRNYVNHDWTNYDEIYDPNLAGPFMGETNESKLIWSFASSQNEAIGLLKERKIIPVSISIDGNALSYWVDKYHDPDYGQIELNFSYSHTFDNPEIGISLKKHGKMYSSNDIRYLNFDEKNKILSIIGAFDNNNFIAIRTKYDPALLKEYGHTNPNVMQP
jgi:hypothetical protein